MNMTTTLIDPKQEKKLQRQVERQQAKRLKEIEAEKNQKPVQSLTITIEWKKSRMWGYNPHATGQVSYKDGTGDRFYAKASGCGYDKKSQVIADLFNQVLKYKLWNKAIMSKTFVDRWGHKPSEVGEFRPYGITAPRKGECETYESSTGANIIKCRYFCGGIGAECYRDISKYIGGKWEQIVNTSTCDVFRYEEASK